MRFHLRHQWQRRCRGDAYSRADTSRTQVSEFGSRLTHPLFLSLTHTHTRTLTFIHCLSRSWLVWILVALYTYAYHRLHARCCGHVHTYARSVRTRPLSLMSWMAWKDVGMHTTLMLSFLTFSAKRCEAGERQSATDNNEYNTICCVTGHQPRNILLGG